ncbi:hypothetical protein BGZ95_000680 [Linnemannia exigua]|uniref:Transmembrane protein n=1 Tax=Linnemannia exigua TaxID=604196 RepID=A0AAD4H463_9FUNG|nr:hypothetical protein BGZ95_000680 [Linnemannia exigua]
MGKLAPDCLTSTPDGSTFYGLDITSSYDETVSDYKEGTSFVIVKSNANPTSPESLTWSVWSRIYLSDLPPMSLSGTTKCAVNNEGVFTFFNRLSSPSYFYPSEPYGYRYDPNGKSDSKSITSYNGRGTWTVVNILYEWKVSYSTHVLEYVNSPTGLSLLHCHSDDYDLNCATFKEDGNALVPAWSWRLGIGTAPVMFAIGHDRLYMLSRAGPLYSYQLFTPSNSLPNSTTPGTPNNCPSGYSNMPDIVINQKAMYLLCRGSTTYSTASPTMLYVNNDTVGGVATLVGPETLKPEFGTTHTIRAIGSGTGDGHFILGASYRELIAITLDGSYRTTYNLTKLTVSDTSGSYDYEDPGPIVKNYVAGTVGGICAFVILAVLGVFYYKRRRSNTNTTQDALQAEAGRDTPADVDSKPAMASAGPSNQLATSPPIESPFTPAAQSIPPQSPTVILPMAPIPPISQQQTVQNQMQELGFSNHPRPTVATTSTGVPWQPTPFVPPSSSQRIRAPELDGFTAITTGDNSTASPPPPIPRSSKPYSEGGSQPIPATVHHPHT